MKKKTNLLFLLFAALFFFLQPQISHGQTALDTLLKYTRQLKTESDNYPLKEKIIAVSKRLTISLPTPFEVDSYTTRGRTAVTYAQAPGDFKNAVEEFKKANLAGPWIDFTYYNLAEAQKAADDNRNAISNYRLYLMASPQAKDAMDVRKKITELEYLLEHPKPTAKENEKKAEKIRMEKEKLRQLQEEENKRREESDKRQALLNEKQQRLNQRKQKANADKSGMVVKDYTYFNVSVTAPVGTYGKNPVLTKNMTYLTDLMDSAMNGKTGTGAKVFMAFNMGHVFYIRKMHVWDDRFKVGFDLGFVDFMFNRFNWKSLGGVYDKSNFPGSFHTKYGTIMNWSFKFGPVFSICVAKKLFIDVYYKFAATMPLAITTPFKIYQSDGSYAELKPAVTWVFSPRHSVGFNLRYSKLTVNFDANLGNMARKWKEDEYDANGKQTLTTYLFTGSVFAPVLVAGVGVNF